MIECTQGYTPRLWSTECEDTLVGCDQASLDMHLEAVIEWVWRCTWRPWLSEFGGVLGGGQSEGSFLGGGSDGSGDSIKLLTRNCANVENWVPHGLPREWMPARDSQSLDNAVRGVCSSQWMLYLVYAALGVCYTLCRLYLVYAVLCINSWSSHG
jgi:hypothetical protein